MDEKDCELIEMLWETRNITKAAERLFTTQSALTKRIQKLEEKLGCELFIRSRKGILFTPVAERILPYVRQVSDSMDRIRSQVAIYRKEVAGTLKLGVSINFARYRLADVLKGFMDQYPNVDIHVSTMQSTNLYQSLVKNEISIAIVRGSFKWNEGMVTLSEEPVCLVTAREHAGEPLNSYPYIGRHTDAGFYDKIQLLSLIHIFKHLIEFRRLLPVAVQTGFLVNLRVLGISHISRVLADQGVLRNLVGI